MNSKDMKKTKSGHKKVRLLNEKKNDKKKNDGEVLRLYDLVEKAAENILNQISNFEELEYEKSFNINQQKLKKKLDNMYQVIDIVKFNLFNFLKKEVEDI